jgi:formylmethanofuran dehydrogenase subunit C
MTGWRLTWRGEGGPPLDTSPLLPDRLAAMSEGAVAALQMRWGNRLVPLGDAFGVAASSGDELIIEGATDRFDHLGRGLAGGRLVVEGDAGDHLANGVTGGEVEVTGRAGRYVASGMTGGTVRVRGNVGGFAGAALPGGRFGMTGGWLLVGGSLGERAGDRMRRGTIVAGGDLGAFAGARMIGGTIVGAGACGATPGYGMRRGTLVLAREPAAILATFADGGAHEFGWLRLLAGELRRLGIALPALSPKRRRVTGCASAGGLGELLIAA